MGLLALRLGRSLRARLHRGARLRRRARLHHGAALTASVTASVLLGCAGLTTPARSPPTSTSRMARAQVTHEYSSASPPRHHASAAGVGNAIIVVRAFALAYINWSAPTLSADLHALAAASIGQARPAMQLAAANAAQDYELKRGGIANSGTVEAVAPMAGSRDRYVIVTHERTSAARSTAYQGLRPAWHITLATVAELAPGQWVVSGWQPQS
jgi:hypothetical protein